MESVKLCLITGPKPTHNTNYLFIISGVLVPGRQKNLCSVHLFIHTLSYAIVFQDNLKPKYYCKKSGQVLKIWDCHSRRIAILVNRFRVH